MKSRIAPRVAIAGFQHETNTFAPGATSLADFERGGAWPAMLHEADMLAMAGLNIPMGGFLEAAQDFDLVPILWTSAEPGGTVTDEAFDTIAAMICERLAAAGPLDGVYLDLHGAMVTATHDDGEAELLRRVREVVGALPVAVSLDLHANISHALAERASTLAIYRTYPHVDMAATGARAAALLAAEISRGGPFERAFAQIDLVIPITAQPTPREPAGRLYRALDEARDVASSDFALGFPPADIPDVGPFAVAYGETREAAEAEVARIAALVAGAEAEFADPLVPAREAVARAMAIARTATGPVLICDPQDNPGAGATGNTTGVLQALVEVPVEAQSDDACPACLGLFFDPALATQAHEAGEGATIDAGFGPADTPFAPGQLRHRARVVRLSDGRFQGTGPFYGGSAMDLGRCARLRLEGTEVEVVVSSARAQNADRAMFTHIGIEPTRYAIVAVKSAVHFMADYAPIAADILFAEAPGANPCRLAALPYTRLRPAARLVAGRVPTDGDTR